MPEENEHSPDTELNSVDRGDDVQRRFRYQSAYAAQLSLELLTEEMEFSDLYCELHEDILLKRNDGRFIAFQVKTREIERGPFKTGDEEILKSLKRFMELERDHPSSFSKYILVTNSGFWKERKNGSNLEYLLNIVKNADDPSILDNNVFFSLNKVVSRIDGEDSHIVFSTLKKVNLQKGPGLEDYPLRLAERLSEIEELEDKRYDKIQRVANNLIEKMSQASSLVYNAPRRDYFALLDDPESAEIKEIIEGKRITHNTVLQIITTAISEEALLRTYEPVELSKLPKGMNITERKMSAGGISIDNIKLAKDHKFSAEALLERWLYKYGTNTATERYEHLSTIVKTECQEAYDACYSEKESFGQKMLKDVRRRLRERHEKDCEHLFDCMYEHLLGIKGIETEKCSVWWSKQFIIGVGKT